MSFYKRIFNNVLNEADETLPPIDAQSDAEQFKQGFEDPKAFDKINAETDATAVPKEDLTAKIDAAEHYAQIINHFIEKLKELQTQFLEGGVFANSGIMPPKLSSIMTDLGALALEIPSELKQNSATQLAKTNKTQK